MKSDAERFLEFGDIRVDLQGGYVTQGGVSSGYLELKLRQTLLLLFENRDRVVTKDEFLQKVWVGSSVNEESISNAISRLRSKIDIERRYIKTVSGEGYRFYIDGTANVTDGTGEATSKSSKLLGVTRGFSPYPGPQEFSERLAEQFFFGRTEELADLKELVDNVETRIIVIHGPSGSGKSSLLNNLLETELKNRFEVLHGVRLGTDLANDDSGTEIQNLFTFAALQSLDLSPQPTSTLAECLNSHSRSPNKEARLLIIDQFEELFTQEPKRPKQQIAFYQDLINTLDSDQSLRVIIGIRKEYLSDLDGLHKSVSTLAVETFRLLPMERANVAEAITKPIDKYTTFADGVVTEIINQLETRDEFIDLVHLQIVCQRLWERLPKGITEIKMEHLQDAAGESRSFEDFVSNALDVFYNDVVKEVARNSVAHPNGEYTKKQIFFGCMQFVSPEGKRKPFPEDGEQVGLLPLWIVEQLVNKHLLTAQDRGGKLWYELAHDRLVAPVSRLRDRDVDQLLYAAEHLRNALKQALIENKNTLTEYFKGHPEIVSECHQFLKEPYIQNGEMEFILRSSLIDNPVDAAEWAKKLGAEDPQICEQVLREALLFTHEVPRNAAAAHGQYPLKELLPAVFDPAIDDPEADASKEAAQSLASLKTAQIVRRNAAAVLGQYPLKELLSLLVDLAINDPEADVRKEAAKSLASLETSQIDSQIIDGLIAGLDKPDARAQTLMALARIRVTAYQRSNAQILEALFRNVSWLKRLTIRTYATALQLWEALPIILCIVIPTGLFASVPASIYKLIPSSFGWALTQYEGNAGPGFFQGAIAGWIWAGLIVLGLVVYYALSYRKHDPKEIRSKVYALMVGGMCGLLGSGILVVIIAKVFNQMVLENIGWILPGRCRDSSEFWIDIFFRTRYALAYLITGTGLGIAMAATIHRLRTADEWEDFKKKQEPLKTFRQAREIVFKITTILANPKYLWPLPTLLLLAACLAFFVPETLQIKQSVITNGCAGVSTPPFTIRSGKFGLFTGLIGDVTTQFVGAFFGIVGMGFGIVVTDHGFCLEPRKTEPVDKQDHSS